MGVSSSNSHTANFSGKVLLIIVSITISRFVFTDGHVIVTVSEPVIGAMEGKSVRMVCEFSDNQRAGANEIVVFWKKRAGI